MLSVDDLFKGRHFPEAQQVQHDDAALEAALHEKPTGFWGGLKIADGVRRAHGISLL